MNKEYFVASSSGVKSGPHTIDDLHALRINSETLIWYEGLPRWEKAGDIPHLQPYFKKTPPALPFSTRGLVGLIGLVGIILVAVVLIIVAFTSSR
jgi:hypothetical protein